MIAVLSSTKKLFHVNVIAATCESVNSCFITQLKAVFIGLMPFIVQDNL